MKKKAIACLLALALSTSNVTALASQNISGNDNVQNINYDLTGMVEVEVNLTRPIESSNLNMNLKLDSKKGSIETKLRTETISEVKTLNLDGKEVTAEITRLGIDKEPIKSMDERTFYIDVKFLNVPCDIYSLNLSGTGFMTVEETVEIANYSKKIYINDKESILHGDFDLDGTVTEKDYNELLSVIDSKESSVIDNFDLNRDGLLDISDLSIVQDNLGLTRKAIQIINTSPIIDPNKIKIAEVENQEVAGNAADLFKEESKVSIKTTEAISETNPAKLQLELEETAIMEEITIDSSLNNGIDSGYVEVETADGEKIKGEFTKGVGRSVKDTIKVSLGKQVAVKKVSIVVTGTTSNTNLVEISRVQFLNNAKDKIAPPEMNIPSITAVSENEAIKVSWNHEPNVTGYEVKATGYVKNEYKEFIIQTTSNTVTFTGLENYNEYEISIQSLNEAWESGYGNTVTAIPKPQTKPEPPEGIKIVNGYRNLKVTWAKHKNADRFNLFYREAGTDEEFTKIEGITNLSYTITNLKDNTEYEVYLTGINDLGEGNASIISRGNTVNINPPVTPKYNLINTTVENKTFTDHILSVIQPSFRPVPGEVVAEGAVVDGDYSTAWTHNDWDTAQYGKGGPTVTFDQKYTIDTIALIPRLDGSYALPYFANVGVYNEETDSWTYEEAKVIHRNNNGNYAVIKLNRPVTSNKFQVNTSVYGGNVVTISELKFYNYDSLENDTRDLFTDDLLIALKKDVDQAKIDKLRERANAIDPISGEQHPERTSILNELQLAEDILNDKNISEDIFTVNQEINKGKNTIGITNDYQALGITAKAGEEIVVYVGTEGNSMPEIAFTQHYGESSAFIKTQRLNKGKNVIRVPEITNMDVEKGGNVYIRYTGNSASDKDIKIRVSGGYKIPHLNVHGLIENDEAKAKEAIKEYILDLQDYVDGIKDNYPKFLESRSNNNYRYDEKTSVLNTTDIESQNITLTLPATAVLSGINDNLTSIDEKADRVYNSLLAFEQLMDIKFSERGLEEDEQPTSRINIKYQRMFIGAFMYASNHHVGIEYDSSAPLMKGHPFEVNEDGTVKEASGELFGWGIAHEIGHVTEITKMTYGEVTNNIIANLAQTFDDKTKSRLENGDTYEKMYEKVTSGTVGMTSDLGMGLGMFWQLHLAYDNDYTAKMLQNKNTFYARLSKRYRQATAEENSVDKNQLLVRFASDAAGKDLTDFFTAWGIVPDEATKNYLQSKGYDKEERKIQYLNDEARRKVLNNVGSIAESTKVTASYNNVTKGEIASTKEVTLNLGINDDSDILGYEIYRNGKVVGFTTDNTFTDYLGALNNRALTYEVVAYDNNLNATEKLSLGEVKVSHDGTISNKSSWTVETNTSDGHNHNACEGENNPNLNKIIDNDENTTYSGSTNNNEDAYIIVGTGENLALSGIKYRNTGDNPLGAYEVYVSNDKENWTLVNSGENMNEGEIIYFTEEDSKAGNLLYTYNASYVKLVAKNSNSIDVSQLDLIMPPGDNVDITEESIGILGEDYVYDKINGDVIPRGSIIVTGVYRGNPVYNVTLLKDENGNVVGGDQVILAEIPEEGHLGEINDGRFIYWIAPENKHLLTSKVKVDLYRVNNPETNEGQRLVSDSLYVDVKEILPTIKLTEESEEAK